MKRRQWSAILVAGTLGCTGLMWLAYSDRATAHCDSMSGPVIADAKAALAKEDVTTVLKWVPPNSEAEVRASFQAAVRVRKVPENRPFADRAFFETVVRLHRTSEGASYTGLKPASEPIEPSVLAADRALASGSSSSLVEEMTRELAAGVRKRFDEVAEKRRTANDSVSSGREYVRAYVEYVHYVERLHKDMAGPAHGHYED